jgi:hypothetical protein
VTKKEIEKVRKEFRERFCRPKIGSSEEEIPLFNSVTSALDVEEYIITLLTELLENKKDI